MSTLLRHPATVPALFARAVDPEPPAARAGTAWTRLVRSAPLMWTAVVLVETPLMKATAAAVGVALHY